MNWKIFKREKPNHLMLEPNFEDNWKTEYYERNVKQGVKSLQEGKTVSIRNDSRGYELALALDIKRQFILEYQKQLSEQIKIEGTSTITIKRI
jgi:hypothetical protein